MIPKIIHYIWLGNNDMPKIAEKCLKSWQKFCPDWQFMRWDESNLDINLCDYTKEAYKNKKYAFVSDVFRLQKLYEFGGVYLDIDVELLKPIDEFLDNNCFTCLENEKLISPGTILSCEKGNEDIKNIFDSYMSRHFILNNKMDLTTICEIFTNYFEKFGLKKSNEIQYLSNITIYPSEYFCPINTITQTKNITVNTYSIHWFSASWYSPWQKFKNKLKFVLNKLSFGLFGKILEKRKNNKKDKIKS